MPAADAVVALIEPHIDARGHVAALAAIAFTASS
jgi:hypothetical protein